MSITKRLISGSIASWVRIGINMSSQVLIVPIYLKYWKVDIYGLWLSIQALNGILSVIDTGHQNFITFELMKVRTDKYKSRKILYSAAWLGLVIGLFQLSIVCLATNLGGISALIGNNHIIPDEIVKEVKYLLILQSSVWIITNSMPGLFVKALEANGYFSRMAWWGVLNTSLVNIVPALAVIMGAGIMYTGFSLLLTSLLFLIPMGIDMLKNIRKIDLIYVKPDWKLAFTNFTKSLAITFRIFLESLRQQGIRVILSPLIGLEGLARFSTMRTVSNVASQGIGTITNPMMPELMRFLQQKEEDKAHGALSTVWIVIVLILTPAVLVLQLFVEEIFNLWTRGAIVFNPFLFSLLSISVLVFAMGQPSVAVVMGNNLLKEQIRISTLVSISLLSLLFGLVPFLGLIGCGWAILGTEVISMFLYYLSSVNWMTSNGMKWPNKLYIYCLCSVIISGIGIILMSSNNKFKYEICFTGVLLLTINSFFYFKAMPIVIKSKILKIFNHTV